ncbi:MAG: hypothetical protein ACE5KV_07185 [Thermoplasmata archaeon]
MRRQVMGIAESLYARELTFSESQKLEEIMKYGCDPVAAHRAQILPSSNQHFPA